MMRAMTMIKRQDCEGYGHGENARWRQSLCGTGFQESGVEPLAPLLTWPEI
jgi:hypothetical protein